MHRIKNLIPQSIKNLYHLAQAVVANVVYGFPSRKLIVVGITGTNGKTTTTQMVARILEMAGKRVAMASTINFKIGGKEWVNTTKYTTLSPFTTQKFIKQAVDASCQYLVLETSSHALDQHRVWGVCYDVAVITNVTREHLDYHKNMRSYRAAKKKLFKYVENNNGKKAADNKSSIIIVNADMNDPEEFLRFNADEKFIYSTEEKKIMTDGQLNYIFAKDINLRIDDSAFRIQDTNFNLQLPGRFNVENALAAISVGVSQGIDFEVMANALRAIKGIPGRMERVSNEKGLQIIVDYAVTPDSLEKLYELVDEIKPRGGRIIAVFGSCGERDRGKRPIMGEIVSRHADVVIVTNEDPYHEDPQQIIEEVAAGVRGKTLEKDFFKILDRRMAIAKALELSQAGDVVIVSGKGAEETMAVGHERLPWNDKKVIKEELEKIA